MGIWFFVSLADSSPFVFARNAHGRSRASLSLAFLLPITPRVLLERDSERRLGTSLVSWYDDHKLALSDKRILYLIGK